MGQIGTEYHEEGIELTQEGFRKVNNSLLARMKIWVKGISNGLKREQRKKAEANFDKQVKK